MSDMNRNLLEEYSGLFELLERQFEERISASEFERLEVMIEHDSTARQIYLQYSDLHGMLQYDTAAPHLQPTDSLQDSTGEQPDALPVDALPVRTLAVDRSMAHSVQRRPRSTTYISVAVSCIVLVVIGGYFALRGTPGHTDIAKTLPPDRGDSVVEVPHPSSKTAPDNTATDRTRRHQPVQINPNRPDSGAVVSTDSDFAGRNIEIVYNAWEGSPVTEPASDRVPAAIIGNSNTEIVAFIDRNIRENWANNEVTPSPQSEDSEWLRRLYLDVVGHIPNTQQAERFLASTEADKRHSLVEELLDDEDYVRNWSTIWTNLLIGRSNPREVNRPALQKYLRESFAMNRGWDDVVGEFISAEGNHRDNGATNFLLAHVNDQALPATATVARLFLGQQLQCLQCHDHPFNDWRQNKFWEFHGFFTQMDVSSNRTSTSLIDNDAVPEVYYETRSGLMQATFPEFNGQRFRPEDVDENTRLRKELASLMTTGETTDVARAFVNRIWLHFFGAAFTPVVDDMGPHAIPSHPELLEGLTRSFVHSGYNVKQLIRWITSSNAYQLSSQFNETNSIDNPASGQRPLFSRVYVKSMTVEQTFDSLMIATQAAETLGSDWTAVDRERQKIQQQFVMQWETEDNDEADLFDGTVPQALMMMNSPLIRTALNSDDATYIGRIVRSEGSEAEKIEAVAMAALSRRPTPREIAAVRQIARSGERHRAFENSFSTRLEDLFWAYLNSNEFILIH